MLQLRYLPALKWVRIKTLVPWIKAVAIWSLFLLPSNAQITPDQSLVNEHSIVEPQNNRFIIKGGASRGKLLFHSLQNLNISPGQSAYFTPPTAIDMILTRITGGRFTTINGTLGVVGNADLFLMNPSGIYFGPHASLDLNGSFIATTATNLIFEHNAEYSAANPKAPPPLSIRVPLGLQFNDQSAKIIAQGSGHQLISTNPLFPLSQRTGSRQFDLTVKPTKTLALLGNTLHLNGKVLTAPGGSIHLGGVQTGFVPIQLSSFGWSFSYQNVQRFGDIQLSQQTLVDGSGFNGSPTGSIHVQGNRVSLTDGSLLRIQNRGNQAGRSLVINASDAIDLTGANPKTNIRSGLTATTLTTGRGSDIALSTPKLVLKEGGLISVSTIGSGTGGTLNINATDSIAVLGSSPLNPSLISLLSTNTSGSGNAGNAFISTPNLRVSAGGLVTSATLSSGNGGNLTLSVSELIEIVGIDPKLFSVSAVTAPSLASGTAGDLTIHTKRLVIKDGARVDSSTFANGTAGSVTINATESIEVNGRAPSGRGGSLIVASGSLVSPELRAAFGLPPIPTGRSGNLKINTPDLRITNGASVSVRNDGPGNAGTLQIVADRIFLANQGGITASTISGNGGDIDLHISNALVMRNNSLISATANGPGDGGNINIDAALIVALPTENSDILANATSGRGGKISITTQGLFGLEVNNQPTVFSDITAISQNDPTLNGIVEVNNPEIDPSDSLTDLPETVEASQTIERGCRPGQALGNSTFVDVGHGGVPLSPSQLQTAPAIWHDLRNSPSLNSKSFTSKNVSKFKLTPIQPSRQPPATKTQANIVEAQSWARDEQGRIVLTAGTTQLIPLHSSHPISHC
ncbi:S-layer family protein [Acaryochloris sp. CCMEE 5410]|uniref:beta strand repeat-containing protein n=1 Tax=Acaryochloris sp. CCMEE 5410 TaxID=310037 RepID=UPI0002E42A83|nr:S-layer family protein [Acaryochloris sp. CCMEE 5410]